MPNLETKVLEIRDSGTYIGVLAIRLTSTDPIQRYHLRRMGHGPNSILVVRLSDCAASNDVYEWPATSRTMPEAHLYIEAHFDDLKDGDVVDVQFIAGETKEPKRSERLSNPWPVDGPDA